MVDSKRLPALAGRQGKESKGPRGHVIRHFYTAKVATLNELNSLCSETPARPGLLNLGRELTNSKCFQLYFFIQ